MLRSDRTRLGRQLNEFGPSYLANFCIPKETPLGDIVTNVVTELSAYGERKEPTSELVYRVLTRTYACRQRRR